MFISDIERFPFLNLYRLRQLDVVPLAHAYPSLLNCERLAIKLLGKKYGHGFVAAAAEAYADSCYLASVEPSSRRHPLSSSC